MHLTATHLTAMHLTAMHLTAMHLTAMHLTAMHLTAMHLTAMHLTAMHLTAMHLTAMHLTAMHLTAMHLTAMHLTAMHLTAMHLTAMHLTAMHLTAMHLTAMHLTAMHLTAMHLTAMHLTGNKADLVWWLSLFHHYTVDVPYEELQKDEQAKHRPIIYVNTANHLMGETNANPQFPLTTWKHYPLHRGGPPEAELFARRSILSKPILWNPFPGCLTTHSTGWHNTHLNLGFNTHPPNSFWASVLPLPSCASPIVQSDLHRSDLHAHNPCTPRADTTSSCSPSTLTLRNCTSRTPTHDRD
ncbi:unnamed protein product [Closterium sp. NIES-54]